MRAAITAGVFGMVLAAIGCGDSEADTKDEFIAQLCAEFADCCVAVGRPGDGAQCRAFYGAFLSSTSGYDQAAADACLDEFRALGSGKCDSASRSTPSCNKVFVSSGGTAKPGEACEDDSDCAPPAAGEVECVSNFVGDATVQQCQVRLPGTEGSAPCVGTVEGNLTVSVGGGDDIPAQGYLCDVADGLSCDSQSGACQALGEVGEACSGGQYACVPSAYCDFTDRMCKASLAVGAACQGFDECVEGASCDTTTGTCVALLAAGEACSSYSDCASGNCVNQKCEASDDLGLVLLCGSS